MFVYHCCVVDANHFQQGGNNTTNEASGLHMRARQGRSTGLAIFLIGLLVVSYCLPVAANAANSKSTTVWSGTVLLPDGYLVGAQDILIIQEGTTIRLGSDESLTIDGRVMIEGTENDPIILESILGKHDGIRFNQSSQGLGSSIENLTITDAEFGITIYGSNPQLTDVTVENADRVAVDLFDGATPTINNLRSMEEVKMSTAPPTVGDMVLGSR